MKKIGIIFMIIFSTLSFGNKTKIDLLKEAKTKEYKKQVYLPDKIYQIYSKPLNGTAIIFGKSESLMSVTVADQPFWETKMIGNQLIIKPRENDLKTSLFVTTNIRDYFFTLVAPKEYEKHYNSVVEFIYPEDEVTLQLEQRRILDEEVSLNSSNIEELNFKYKWRKSYSWSPSNIFDDGDKTIIELSEKDKDIPSFYLKKEGKLVLVMTRTKMKKNGRKVIVVDRIFQEGVLAMGKKQIMIFNKNWKR